MAALDEIVSYLDGLLRIEEVPDYEEALNGLQLGNGGEISRIGAAVDACSPVIERAIEAGIDLLIVHHGLFWGGAQPIVGGLYQKMKGALEGNLAVYSAHIPLDVHPDFGNNALLARALGLVDPRPFFDWKGIQLGLRATAEGGRAALVASLEKATGGGAVHLCPGGPESIREVGVITGGAGGEISQVAAAGIDTFITGEGPHWSYTAAEELGVNILYGGHYATETFGVRALAQHLGAREDLPWEFIDHPSGM
ncbi:MAG: Nif3-like dinuclear metal center hexameric protein [Verrucomicrobiales bacterium]